MTTLAPPLDTPLLRVLRDGVAGQSVALADIERVVEQHVIHGGALDTLLLEAGVLDEHTLARALAVAHDTEAVDAAVLDEPDVAAVRLLPARMATAMALLPFRVDDGGAGRRRLHVACLGATDPALCDEVGALLGVDVVAHAVPEVRLRHGLHRAYGAPLDDRFVALLRPSSSSSSSSSSSTVSGAVAADAVVSAMGAPVSMAPASSAPGSQAPDEQVTWDLVEALAHLAAQDSRDGIARVAVTYARRFLPFAAVFGVKDDHLIGWSRSGPVEGVLFTARPLRVADDALVRTALTSPSPWLGRPQPTPGNAAFFGWLGRRRPQSALLVPVVVGKRPVAALFADGGIRARELGALGELVAFAARLGPAFESLLRARQRQNPSLYPSRVDAPSLVPTAHALVATTLPSPSAASLTAPATDVVAGSVVDASAVSAASPGPSSAGALDEPSHDAGASLVDVAASSSQPPAPSSPAPAPSDETPAGTPSMAAASRPPFKSERDGTSPFARAYVPPAHRGDDAPLVLAGVGSPLLDSGLRARLEQAAPPEVRAQRPALFAVDDADAPEAWQAALTSTVEQGLQGGSVLDEEGGWEDVAFDVAHLAALGAPSVRAPSSSAPSSSAPSSSAPSSSAPSSSASASSAPSSSAPSSSAPSSSASASSASASSAAASSAPSPSAPSSIAPASSALVSSARRLPPSFPDLSVAALASLDLDEVDVQGAATAPVEVHRWTDRPALPEVEIDVAGFDDSGQKAPAPRFAVAPPGIASLSHAALVEQLFEDDDERVARAVRELVGRGGAVVDAVAERFPGRLRVDPFDPAHGSPGAAEVGPLVDVLAQLGRAGLDAALPYVESRHPAHRFAAVLLFALSPDVRALDLLRARLHDAEPRIRALAVEAVQPFLAHPRFEGLLFDLRERATSDRLPTAIRRRSVELLGVFRDVGAVPLLVRLLDGPLADTARHSLRTITLVDLGARPRAWEKWWARARKRSRVDWLLDALAADELALRREAHRELAAFAGDDFGYRPDAEKRARARAIEVWRQWWAEEQKHADEPLALTRS